MFWYLWWFCAGSLLTLWVRRLPSEREYERFLILLGAEGALLRTRCNNYRDVRAGIASWRNRRSLRQMAAQQKRRPMRVRSVLFALCLCGLWPVLTASAPLPRQTCTEQTAAYLVRRAVSREITSNGQALTVPAGFAVGWSCTSAQDAEMAWLQAAAKVGAP